MSKGPGKCQRAILDAIQTTPQVRLTGNRSQYTAQLRAAKALVQQGRCALVRLWEDESRQRLYRYVAWPGAGRPGGHGPKC